MNSFLPPLIRVSIGSANVLGLNYAQNQINPTTCYIMTHIEQSCEGNCAFCSQASGKNEHQDGQLRKSQDKLSRITWPEYSMADFLDAMKKNQGSNSNLKFKRVCLQVLNYPQMISESNAIIQIIHSINPKLLISSAFPPIPKNSMKELKQNGLERIGIALDAATPLLFSEIKGEGRNAKYRWEIHWQALNDALEVFGSGFVSTHFIIGLGETEEQLANQLLNTIQKKILPGIFLFTPIRGTAFEKKKSPPIEVFRRIQLIRYLLLKNIENINRFQFQDGILIKIKNLTKNELKEIINQGNAFKTAGCPDCNRPYYTSSPSKEPDGFARDLTKEEKEKIFLEINHLIVE